uniref:ITPR-interacting domain-containing protein n=1 Tax=Varanus komodoensis TaxID=61221 RepID=A0A8D2IXA0_VARKO
MVTLCFWSVNHALIHRTVLWCIPKLSFSARISRGTLSKALLKSSISEVLDLCEVDAETILCNLGFMQEEMEAASWIPARFFAVPSQAQGIDFQLLLRSQVQRIEMEDPCLMLACRCHTLLSFMVLEW